MSQQQATTGGASAPPLSCADVIAEAVEMVHITGRRLEMATGASRVAAQVVHDQWKAELGRLDQIKPRQRFDPHAWFQDWRDAGGSFARVDDRLVLGVFVGQGEDASKLSALMLALDRTAGARDAVMALLDLEREQEAA